MADYGAAVSFLIILFVIGVTGILVMCLTPLIDTFLALGTANIGNGVDAVTLSIIEKSIKIYFPICVILSMILFGYRKSKNRIE